MKATSFTDATCAFWGPRYFVLGSNVASPVASKALRRHGPSSPLCQNEPAKVEVVEPSFVRYVSTALHAASVLVAPKAPVAQFDAWEADDRSQRSGIGVISDR